MLKTWHRWGSKVYDYRRKSCHIPSILVHRVVMVCISFFGFAAWRALWGCRLRLRGRGSWFLEGPYQQVQRGWRHVLRPCGTHIFTYYLSLIVHRKWWFPTKILVYWILLVYIKRYQKYIKLRWHLGTGWNHHPRLDRGVHGSLDAVCQLAATSEQLEVVPRAAVQLIFKWKLQENPSRI